jgi:hypothetical protein
MARDLLLPPAARRAFHPAPLESIPPPSSFESPAHCCRLPLVVRPFPPGRAPAQMERLVEHATAGDRLVGRRWDAQAVPATRIRILSDVTTRERFLFLFLYIWGRRCDPQSRSSAGRKLTIPRGRTPSSARIPTCCFAPLTRFCRRRGARRRAIDGGRGVLLLSGTPKPETSFEAALLRGRGTAALSSHLVVCRSARAEEVAVTRRLHVCSRGEDGRDAVGL